MLLFCAVSVRTEAVMFRQRDLPAYRCKLSYELEQLNKLMVVRESTFVLTRMCLYL